MLSEYAVLLLEYTRFSGRIKRCASISIPDPDADRLHLFQFLGNISANRTYKIAHAKR